jgi:hypothetical protein
LKNKCKKACLCEPFFLSLSIRNKQIKVMTKEKTVEQIRDEITANYKEQVEILKAMNETNNRLIEAYRTREESLEDYVAALKEQLARVQGLYLGLI